MPSFPIAGEANTALPVSKRQSRLPWPPQPVSRDTPIIIKKISKILRNEHPDYIYLRDLFKKLREEFNIKVTTQTKRLPYVPTEEELKHYYDAVWKARNVKHMVLIKILLYTGIRVQELVNVKLTDVDFDRCQIRINRHS